MGHVLMEIKEMCCKNITTSPTNTTPNKQDLTLPLDQAVDWDHGRTIKSPQADKSGVLKVADSTFFDDVPPKRLESKSSEATLTNGDDSCDDADVPSEVNLIVSSALQFATDEVDFIFI